MTTTPHKCPFCMEPLASQAVDGGFSVWCPHGICLSQAANDGAFGKTMQEALTALALAVEREEMMENE